MNGQENWDVCESTVKRVRIEAAAGERGRIMQYLGSKGYTVVKSGPKGVEAPFFPLHRTYVEAELVVKAKRMRQPGKIMKLLKKFLT